MDLSSEIQGTCSASGFLGSLLYEGPHSEDGVVSSVASLLAIVVEETSPIFQGVLRFVVCCGSIRMVTVVDDGDMGVAVVVSLGISHDGIINASVYNGWSHDPEDEAGQGSLANLGSSALATVPSSDRFWGSDSGG